MLLALWLNLAGSVSPPVAPPVDTHDGAGGVWQDRKRLRAIEEARAKRWRAELAELNELAAELRATEEPEEVAPVLAQAAHVMQQRAPVQDAVAFDAYMAALWTAIAGVQRALEEAAEDEDEDEDLMLVMGL